MAELKDYYKVLQVDPSAESEIIAAAYRRLALKYHPDTNKSPESTRKMQEINEAYRELSDPGARTRYDQERDRRRQKNQTKTSQGEEERRQKERAEAEQRAQADRRKQAEAEAARRREREKQAKTSQSEEERRPAAPKWLLPAIGVVVVALVAASVVLFSQNPRTTAYPRAAPLVKPDRTATSVGVALPSAPPATEYATGQITFCGTSEDGPGVYVISPEGTEAHRVIESPPCNGRPVWSPDGTLIAYPSGQSGSRDIYVAAADGSYVRQITSSIDDEGGVTWSPDGRFIAFYAGAYGREQIYVVAIDGSSLRNICQPLKDCTSPTWSPAGDAIAFDSWTEDGYEIWVMGTDGSGKRPLIAAGYLVFDESPAWSPDGRLIAFESNRDGDAFARDIYVADTNGTNIRRLTRYVAKDNLPAWSPDGHFLAFLSERDGVPEIYVMGRDGSGQFSVTKGCCQDISAPSWSTR